MGFPSIDIFSLPSNKLSASIASFGTEFHGAMALLEELPQVYVGALLLIWLIAAMMSFRICVRSQF